MSRPEITKEEAIWTLIIRPKRAWYDLRMRELWEARELVMLFVWRDFISYYKQTILGPLWYLIQPLLTTLVFTVIFGRIASLPTDGLPPFLFYMAGTVVWSYFAACLTKTAETFIANSGLFGKVYFPRLAVPFSILVSSLIAFAIQFGLFIIFVVVYTINGDAVQPNLAILLTPLFLIMMAGLGLGFGIIISSLTTRYRDLRQLITFGVQLWMYATPVVYPLSAVPQKLKPLIMANPLTAIVEAFRYAYLGQGIMNPWLLSYSFGFMLVVLLVGVIIFNRVEATFMDTV
jgi:lipopolysaccharide transport system permease protein